VDRSVEDELNRPDRDARLQEIESLVEQGLALLTAEHREILILREIQGHDYESIAEITGCRKGTVKSRIARAREQLRQRIVELGGDEL